jgi:hypothetical protein
MENGDGLSPTNTMTHYAAAQEAFYRFLETGSSRTPLPGL